MNRMLMPLLSTALASLTAMSISGCEDDLLTYEAGDIRIHVSEGSEWLHDYDLFLGLSKKNAPQMAIWIEDEDGGYLSTVYVTHKAATQDWIADEDERREEALPHWCHQRGVMYDDGLYMPTRNRPLLDGISGATPRESFDVKLKTIESLSKLIVKVEVNHSTDFNRSYPKDAHRGDDNYSGGRHGSGQPAVVYAAEVDMALDQREFEAQIIGHSSPDGSDGKIYEDLTGLTTALNIVDHITISIEK